MSTDLPHSPVPKTIPKFLSFSIVGLVMITFFTVIMLFMDTVEGKSSRIFLTLFVFGIFTVLTALDTVKSNKKKWYPPTALLSNGVFLAFSLVTIWTTNESKYIGLTSIVLFFVIFTFLILRIGIWLSVLSMGALDNESEYRPIDKLERYSSVAGAWLVNASAIMFVTYFGVQSIIESRNMVSNHQWWDDYIKLSTALLIIAGLALSISLLLRWYFGADLKKQERLKKRALREEQVRAQREHYERESTLKSAEKRKGNTQEELLPWPTFEDGSPFPAMPDGQPDFVAAERIRESKNADL